MTRPQNVSLASLLALLSAFVLACAPEGPTDAGDASDAGYAADAGDAADAGNAGDAGDAPNDAGRDPTDGGQPPQDSGSPVSDAGPPPECDPGFEPLGQSCVPEAPEPFRSRPAAEVCGRWMSDFQNVHPEWQAGDANDPCDPGTVPEAALDNGLRRTNLYRWLAGLEPVTLDEQLFPQQQACAVLQRAMGALNHGPPQNAPCYTSEGAAGAGSSNLARGTGLADSVDLYVEDRGVESLGHRRWVLDPRATTTQFGFKPNWSCMYSFSGIWGGGSTTLPFVSWPPPGFVPTSAASGVFSFASTTYRPTQDTVVEIAVNDEPFTEVPHKVLVEGYGWGSTLSFVPPDGVASVWRQGTTVRVRVRDTTSGDIGWTTHFVGCT